MVRRRQVAGKRPPRVAAAEGFLAGRRGRKSKKEKRALQWKAMQAASGQYSRVIAITKEAFVANVLRLFEGASKPLGAAEIPLLYRAQFGTPLNRSLISTLDEGWTGVTAMMQSEPFKGQVVTVWDKHHHPAFARTAGGSDLDLEGFSLVPDPATAQVEDVAPTWLRPHQTQCVVSYDTTKWPFRSIWQDLLQVEELADLHRRRPSESPPPACPTVTLAHRQAGYALPVSWEAALQLPATRKAAAALQRQPAYAALLAAYRSLIEEVVVPLCGDPSGVWYQLRPTLRIHMPPAHPDAAGPGDSPHRELDAPNHSASEIAFCVPLTPCDPRNALFVEREPGTGDFEPLCGDFGQLIRFNAAQCHHYNAVNTSDSTRVSLDFRVVPNSLFEAGAGGYIGHHRAAFAGPGARSETAGPQPGQKRKRTSVADEEDPEQRGSEAAPPDGSDSEGDGRPGGAGRRSGGPPTKQRRLDSSAEGLRANLRHVIRTQQAKAQVQPQPPATAALSKGRRRRELRRARPGRLRRAPTRPSAGT